MLRGCAPPRKQACARSPPGVEGRPPGARRRVTWTTGPDATRTDLTRRHRVPHFHSNPPCSLLAFCGLALGHPPRRRPLPGVARDALLQRAVVLGRVSLGSPRSGGRQEVRQVKTAYARPAMRGRLGRAARRKRTSGPPPPCECGAPVRASSGHRCASAAHQQIVVQRCWPAGRACVGGRGAGPPGTRRTPSVPPAPPRQTHSGNFLHGSSV